MRERWEQHLDHPADPDEAHAKMLRRLPRDVNKYCHDLAAKWLQEGALRFELTRPEWYTNKWIARLPRKLAGMLVLDQASASSSAADVDMDVERLQVEQDEGLGHLTV